MERYPRHLLAGFGGEGSDKRRRVEQEPHTDMETADREVELSLGLSLGGLAGSSSARSNRAATEGVAPTPSAIIAGMISPPITADVGDSSGSHWNGVKLEPSVNLPGNGVKIEPSVNLPGNGIKLEPSVNLPVNGVKIEPSVNIPETSLKVEPSLNLPGNGIKVDPSSSGPSIHVGIPAAVFPVVLLAAGANTSLLAGASSSMGISAPSFAVLEAAIGPMGEHQLLSGGQNSERDVESMVMEEMPFLYTTGISNGRTVKGILYEYRKSELLSIVCMCHGSFLTPVEFVRHTGGGDVTNPLRHIFMSPPS